MAQGIGVEGKMNKATIEQGYGLQCNKAIHLTATAERPVPNVTLPNRSAYLGFDWSAITSPNDNRVAIRALVYGGRWDEDSTSEVLTNMWPPP